MMTNNSVITHATAYEQDVYEPISANLTPRQTSNNRFDIYDNRGESMRERKEGNNLRMSRSFNDIGMDRNMNMNMNMAENTGSNYLTLNGYGEQNELPKVKG